MYLVYLSKLPKNIQCLYVRNIPDYDLRKPLYYKKKKPCRVGSVGSVSASRTAGREFASQPGHTKDHHKNGTNCLPA